MSDPLYEAVLQIAQHCWKGGHWEKTPTGPRFIAQALRKVHLERHVGDGPRVGLAPIIPGESTTRVAVLDFDSHKGEVAWDEMVRVAHRVSGYLTQQRGLSPISFRSSGGQGIHLVMLWEEPQDAYSVRELLREALQACELAPGTKGVKEKQVEIFPKQDSVPTSGKGSMFILPLGGESELIDLETGEAIAPDDMPGQWPYSAAVPVLERPPKEERTFTKAEHAPGLEWLAQALEKLPNRDLDYDEWFKIICAIHHADSGPDGLALAHRWSAKSAKYEPSFLDERVWPYIKDERDGGAITAEYILRQLEKQGHNEHVLDELGVQDLPVSTEREQAPEVDKPQEENRFKARAPLEVISELGMMKWLIDGVLPDAELGVIYGPPGAGKSFVALDVLRTVAMQGTWAGRRVLKGGPVAYVVAEGKHGIPQRLRALEAGHDIDLKSLPMDVFLEAPNLMSGKDAAMLSRALVARANARQRRYRLIVIDTLAASSVGANENSGEDMSMVLDHARAIARANGCMVVLVHHVGKDETKGARGWSGIKGTVDAQLLVQRSDALRTVTTDKVKDEEDQRSFEFHLERIELGEHDGRMLSSCIVEMKTRPDGAAAMVVKPPSGTRRAHVWRTVRDLCELSGVTSFDAIRERMEAELPEGAKFRVDNLNTALLELIANRRISANNRMSEVRFIK